MFLKSIWNWLDGKKTIIATIFWSFTMPALNIIYPNGIPVTLNKVTLLIGLTLSALGLGHKAVKSFMGNDDNTTPAVEDQTPPVEPGK